MCGMPDFRRAGTPDALCGCDRRTSSRYARCEAREGYARVSFLGARRSMNGTGELSCAQKDTAR